jgi:ATP-binding cassette subfamily B protein
MATFIYYVVWLVFPMFDIGQFLVKSRQSAVSINRLQELENVPPMIKDNEVNPPQAVVRGRLSFENIDFSFDGATQKIIDNVSFEVGAGKTVALVGKVGSGKTWLINMVPRLVDPTSGKVKLDGVELRDYPVAELRKMIGYVPQEPSLFSDSIRNNILFGRPEIPETILEWAIEVAQLKDDIASFPKGLETEIGTRGVSISGGQKQRLGLARALVGKPKVLILDDCTSALDARTETDLWNRLHQVLPDMTAIIITHRPDTLEKVDMIYVTENGKIVESGTHIELMKKSGDYARIYRRYQLEEQVSA